VSLYASFNGTLGTTIDAPEHAFDGDISTMWMHDIAGAFWRTWIGLDFTGHNVAYCVKRIRIYQAISHDLELQYYDEDEHEWVTTDSDIDGTGDDWVELDVNGNDVFAYKWRLQFPMGTVGGLKELELYGVPYNPLMAGFNKDNEKIYELSDDGLRIFNDRLFMNNNQAAVIIDQGSNDNGFYVRWSNGLQICWHYFGPVTLDIDDLNAGVYRSALQEHTFPVPFIESPAIAVSQSTPGNLGTWLVGGCTSGSAGRSKWRYRALRMTSGTDVKIQSVGMIAIGRWKELEES